MEEPNIRNVISLSHEQGLEFEIDKASFYLGREKLSIGKNPMMIRWRSRLFLFMSCNAVDAASFFDIPPDQIMEVGVQLEL